MRLAKLDPKVAEERYSPPKRVVKTETPTLARRRAEAKKLPALWKMVVQRLFPDRRHFDEFDVLTPDRPVSAGCETTNVCNARCSFCGYGKGADGKDADPRLKGKVELETLRHTLKLFSEAGGGDFAIEPILGEITVHPGWLDLVREAGKYPNITAVSTYTNGILLDRFDFKEILTSGLTLMNISSSLADRDSYKRLYGVDKYDQVVANITGLLKTNVELGKPVDISLLLRIDKPHSAFYESDLYKELRRYLDADRIVIEEEHWDDFKGLIKLEGLPQGHSFRPQLDKTLPCYALFRKLQVLADGTVQACACRVEPELWAGNIKDYDNLQDAWHDPRLEEIRDDWFEGKRPSCCEGCSHYYPYTVMVPDMSVATVGKRALGAIGRRIGRLFAR